MRTVVGDCLPLPSHIEGDWINIITSVINSRVASVPNQIKVHMFCDLAKRKNTSDILANSFMTHAVEALDDIFATKHVCLCNNGMYIYTNFVPTRLQYSASLRRHSRLNQSG